VEQLAQEIARLAPAEIVADASVAAGGCRVLTEFGEIDQRIASQLSRIEQELMA
jgi:flagellar biosynthesis/type III secretory pathway protein FliH